MAKIKKTIKTIKVDADRCNGCRGCEIICSAYHSEPKYSSINPAKSRIQILTHRLKDIWLPVFAGEYTPAECMGRDVYTIDGKEYDECAFCRAACPSRDLFKDPDSGLPLRCDMCEGRGRAHVRQVVPQRRFDLRGAGRSRSTRKRKCRRWNSA